MKTVEIKIPEGYEVDKEKSTFEKIVFKKIEDKFDKIYAYHNTNKEEFDKLYENLPKHVKAFQKEVMLVEYYNRGEKLDWNNKNQRKWYPWFYLDNDDFRLRGVDFGSALSNASVRLYWLRKEDLEEALELYFDVFKESRTS